MMSAQALGAAQRSPDLRPAVLSNLTSHTRPSAKVPRTLGTIRIAPDTAARAQWLHMLVTISISGIARRVSSVASHFDVKKRSKISITALHFDCSAHYNTEMDRQSVYTLSLFGEGRSANGDQSRKQTQQELLDFILEFHLENVFIYR